MGACKAFRFLATSVLLGVSVLPTSVLAELTTGRVVGIADGDTITVLDASRTQHKIRLSGIDAPEKTQPFGSRSKQALSALAFQRTVTVEWSKKDRYGRIVGKLLTHDGIDVNLEQVKEGLAWHYKHYEREQSPEDKATYAEAEENARRHRVGLWRDAAPIPPWQYRKRERYRSGVK